MKRIKYTPPLEISGIYKGLQPNRIYDVCKYKIDKYGNLDYVTIILDNGEVCEYPNLSWNGKYEFTDVTTEYRNEIIDGILK